MRSARGAFSLSINAPQTAMVLSASSAAAAAAQGAGSARGLTAGSVPVARAACGSATHRMEAQAAFRTRAMKLRGTHFPEDRFRYCMAVASDERFEQR